MPRIPFLRPVSGGEWQGCTIWKLHSSREFLRTSLAKLCRLLHRKVPPRGILYSWSSPSHAETLLPGWCPLWAPLRPSGAVPSWGFPHFFTGLRAVRWDPPGSLPVKTHARGCVTEEEPAGMSPLPYSISAGRWGAGRGTRRCRGSRLHNILG